MSKRVCTSLLSAPQRRVSSGFHPSRGSVHDRIFRHANARFFSSSNSLSANSMSASRQINQASQSRPSVAVTRKTQQRLALRDGSMLDFAGILPGTFVPPTGSNLPSWFSSPRARWALTLQKLLNTFKLLQSYFVAWLYVQPRMKLEYRQSARIARELYEKMNVAFAAGKIGDVERILSPGLAASLRGRIAQRGRDTAALDWKLHRYHKLPQTVSLVFSVVNPKAPRDEQTGIVQAVVQLRSLQSALRLRSKRTRNPETGVVKVRMQPVDIEGLDLPPHSVEEYRLRRCAKWTTEYLVIQKFIRRGKVGEWHVWGTTEETTLKVLEKNARERERMLVNMPRR